VAPHVFAAEAAAYRIAAAHPELLLHVPAYFGPTTVTDVVDEDETEIRRQYWLQCCYAMERLVPDPEERKHLMKPFEQLFEAAGIRHLGDATVLHWKTARPLLIDFAVSDAAADHARLPPTSPSVHER
jgi:hypothetical protein